MNEFSQEPSAWMSGRLGIGTHGLRRCIVASLHAMHAMRGMHTLHALWCNVGGGGWCKRVQRATDAAPGRRQLMGNGPGLATKALTMRSGNHAIFLRGPSNSDIDVTG